MKKPVMCVVQRQDVAEGIVAQLQGLGFSPDDVSVLFPDQEGVKDFAPTHRTKAPEGAVVGASTGTVVGGALGLLAGIGALAIPGLGLVIAAGPLMAAAFGAAAGAGAFGIAGALIGMSIPEASATKYKGKTRDGNILLAVHADTPEDRKRAEEVFKRARAKDASAVTETSVRIARA